MQQNELIILLRHYISGNISAADADQLAAFISNDGNKEQVIEAMAQAGMSMDAATQFDHDRFHPILQNIFRADKPSPVVPLIHRKIFRWAAAASIIIVVGLASYFTLFKDSSPGIKDPVTRTPSDVNPGGYKARLTLADGRVIILDSIELGELTKQGNTSVINKQGQLEYKTSQLVAHSSQLLYNTVSTNNGETYSMTLADGTKVWLNSASSIRFPVAFSGSERKVEITGEAYFEVTRSVTASGAKQSFIVTSNGVSTEVLGTHFNINAYSDEETVKVTLLEGSVKVSNTGGDVTIKPGQQVRITSNLKPQTSNDILLEEVIAWKQGFFHFESADLKTVLRQFARWYDIEVIYEGPIVEDRFFTIMSRNTTLATVLKSLQANNVKFRIEGKRLYVEKG